MKTNLIITTAAAAAMLTALPAAAQSLHRIPAFDAPARTAAQEPRGLINDVKTLGTYMFASTNIDAQHERAFVDFYSNRPYPLHKLKLLHTGPDDITNRLYVIYGGCNTPDGYVGMMARAYTLSILPDAWVKVDTRTGEFEEMVSYKNAAGYQWEYSHDYAWNPGDGLLYGLAPDMDYNPETDVARGIVGTVDPATGAFTKIKTLKEYYFCMAFDYDGVPYGIRWKYDLRQGDQPIGAMLTRFTKDWEVDWEKELLPEGNAFEVNYIGSLEFDYTTGDLWWAGMNSDMRQYLFRIDPDTGDVQKIGGVGYSEAIVGLYVPYLTADHREAPARVDGLGFTACTDGSQQATLSWTNPVTQWNRKPLTQLGDVEIYRDDLMSPIAIVSDGAAPGTAMSYTDTKGTQGLHTYYVIPTNDKGLGVMDSICAYVGRDVPGTVQNLTAVVASNGHDVSVVWKKPAAGAHDGWYDTEGLTYNVTRLPDGKTVATGLNKTTVKDSDIDVVERYSYVVTAVSKDGEGTPLESAQVLAGTYVPLPYFTDFEIKTDANRWTAVDNTGDGKTFEYCDFDWPNGVGRCWRHILSEYGNDDDLVSPPLNMEAGKTYKMTVRMNFHDLNQYSQIGCKAGAAVDNLTLVSQQEHYSSSSRYDQNEDFAFYYTAAATEPTYLAINFQSGRTGDVVRIVSVQVEEEFDRDLAALSFETPLEMVARQESPVKVQVYNNGSQTQSAYTVQLCYDNIVVGQTQDVPELKTRTGAEVEFTVTPDQEMSGMQPLYARVVLDGDRNAPNNASPVTEVEILNAGKVAVNHTVATEETGLSSTLPMQHYNVSSMIQTIYPAAELMLPRDGSEVWIHRLGWEYTVEPTEDGSDPTVLGTTVQVALGQTEALQFNSTYGAWRNERTKVAEARVQFQEGTHYLMLDLDQPFRVDPTRSLIVTVAKHNATTAGDWLVFFSIYGENWTSPSYWHSLKSTGTARYDLFGNPNSIVVPEAPKLMLAISDTNQPDALPSLTYSSGAIAWEPATSTLRLGGEGLSRATVVDFAGRIVAAGTGSASDDRLAVDLAPGFYIVRAQGADGAVRTAKICIR